MLYNYNYGKLINGNLIYAPLNLQIDNTWYIPATKEQYIHENYLEIIDTEQPTPGFYTYHWEQQNDKIVKVWEKQEDPIDTRTPAQKREQEYQTRLCILFPANSETYITIDDAVKLVYEYSCEETDKAREIVQYLKEIITVCKQEIREEYPDEE